MVAAGLGLWTAGKQLLDDATFAIRPGRRVGLVGRNGGGKSTLLAVIEALAEGSGPPEHVAAQGTLSITGGTRVAVLPQSPQLAFRGSVASYLDACAREVGVAWSDYQRLTRLLEAGGAGDALLGAYGEALETMDRLGAWEHEARRSEVLSGLGVPANEFAEREVATLSGGEATRVALAGVLLAPADLVLLDEPSNNLDLAGVRFLASWIAKATFSLLLVSHDRDLSTRPWTRSSRSRKGPGASCCSVGTTASMPSASGSCSRPSFAGTSTRSAAEAGWRPRPGSSPSARRASRHARRTTSTEARRLAWRGERRHRRRAWSAS